MGAFLVLLGLLCLVSGIIWFLVTLLRRKDLRKPAVLLAAAVVMVVAGSVLLPSQEEASPEGVSPPSPTRTPNPTRTSTPPPTSTPTFVELKSQAVTLSYDDLFRNNEQHRGKVVAFSGEVVQINELSSNNYLLRVNVTQVSGSFWKDDVRVDYSGPRLLENDIVEFVGSVQGLWAYKAVLGNERTIPHIRASQLVVPAVSPPPAATPTRASAGTPLPSPTPTPVPEPIRLSGRGQQASSQFHLNQGLTVFKMTHDGRSNFNITLLDSQGQRVDLLVNEIGSFDGSKAVGISQPGTYILDISADGNWTVTIQ